MKRTLYFFYYLKTLDKKKYFSLLDYSSQKINRSKTDIVIDSIYSSFYFNVSLIDYFYFRFYELDKKERQKRAGTGFMYEYQLRMNPKHKREMLENKIAFLKHYKPFVKRSFISIDESKENRGKVESLFTNISGKLVLKASRGQVGAEVEVIQTDVFISDNLLKYMQTKGFDLVEEYVVQHPDMMALSPSGLNTVRIFTQLHNGQVDLLGARLRITVNSPVDNMAAGNLAAPIDPETGKVNGPGVYSDITKSDETVHPVTGTPIEGFQIPYWSETLQMANDAALFNTDNRSIGWDIAITPDGPELIEGNHNWCKLLWQLPVKKGLKDDLLKYL